MPNIEPILDFWVHLFLMMVLRFGIANAKSVWLETDHMKCWAFPGKQGAPQKHKEHANRIKTMFVEAGLSEVVAYVLSIDTMTPTHTYFKKN